MCSHGQGLVRAASGTTLGVLGTSKMKDNERFYGFTDFRGMLARRGRGRHASVSQVTAGVSTPVSTPLKLCQHHSHPNNGQSEAATVHRTESGEHKNRQSLDFEHFF